MAVSDVSRLMEAAGEGSTGSAVFLLGKDGAALERLYSTEYFGPPTLYRRVNHREGHRLYILDELAPKGEYGYVLPPGRADLPDIDVEDEPAEVLIVEAAPPAGLPAMRLNPAETLAVFEAAGSDPGTIIVEAEDSLPVKYEAEGRTVGGVSLNGRSALLRDGTVTFTAVDDNSWRRTYTYCFFSAGGRFDPYRVLHGYRREVDAGAALAAVRGTLDLEPDSIVCGRIVWQDGLSEPWRQLILRDTALEESPGDGFVDFTGGGRFTISRRGLVVESQTPSGEPYEIELNIFLPAAGRKSPLYGELMQ